MHMSVRDGMAKYVGVWQFLRWFGMDWVAVVLMCRRVGDWIGKFPGRTCRAKNTGLGGQGFRAISVVARVVSLVKEIQGDVNLLSGEAFSTQMFSPGYCDLASSDPWTPAAPCPLSSIFWAMFETP